MNRRPLLLIAALLLAIVPPVAGDPAAEPVSRELYVPLDELPTLLAGPTRRVLLSRKEYDALVKKARPVKVEKPPQDVVLLSADYTLTIEDERARIAGTLMLDVLADGLHAVPLALEDVGIRQALLDGEAANIGRLPDDTVTLFVEGQGRHRLTLELLTELGAGTAQQALNFRVPCCVATRLHAVVPGNVEAKEGADVISRKVDERAGVTRFELLPRDGRMTLAFSLNNRQQRQQRVVVARGVLIDSITAADERLYATVSLSVLHRAVDRFRFEVPASFEVLEVQSPALAHWSVSKSAAQRILEVVLRQATTETVVLRIAAMRASAVLKDWTFPRLTALDVAGQVSVLGLSVEDRLKPTSLVPTGLIPFDVAVLNSALEGVTSSDQPASRMVAAYYAPEAGFKLDASFIEPPAELRVTSNLLLVVSDARLEVVGGFTLAPTAQRRFDFDFIAPAGWQVLRVKDQNQALLPVDRYPAPGGSTRVHVRLPTPITAGEARSVYFDAESIPDGWLSDWTSRQVAFPAFAVVDAAKDLGAIAVGARDDLTVRPDKLVDLTPLDEAEKKDYGLTTAASQLAYRYEARGYAATLSVERPSPRATARSYSFYRIDPDLLTAHYELIYDVTRARAERLSFLLPDTTPTSVSVSGLDGLAIKETSSEAVAGKPLRRWTAQLAAGRKGRLRLAVDFQQALPMSEPKGYVLPAIAADGVDYQSGIVAVEGNATFDVQVVRHPRRADVGELVDADYQVGRRLLGVFGFVGKSDDVAIDVTRHPAYPLPAALVQQADLTTLLAASGVSQTSAGWQLRAKLPFLEVELPPDSTLWSAELDGKPLQPQQHGRRLLLSLPADAGETLRDLRIVYETPVARVRSLGRIELSAPRLAISEGDDSVEVPVADLHWDVYLPTGQRVLRSRGTVNPIAGQARSELGAWQVAAAAFRIGGTHFPPAGTTARQRKSAVIALSDTSPQLESEFSDMAPSAGEKSQLAAGRAAAPAAAEKPQAGMGGGIGGMGGMAAGGKGERLGSATGKKITSDLQAGKRSLHIDLQAMGEPLRFESLGVAPRIDVVLVDAQRLHALAWLLALCVALWGLALTPRPARVKWRFLISVWLAATLIPLVTGWFVLAAVFNGAFYAACLLAVFYLLLGIFRFLLGGDDVPAPPKPTTIAAGLGCLLAVLATSSPAAAQQPAASQPIVVQVVPPAPPVHVPDDATVLLYDSDKADELTVPKAERLLVPYDRYVELWNRAYPDRKLTAEPPPADYAPAGAKFSTTLAGEQFLTVTGTLQFDVFVDNRPIDIPLPLRGGVLASALLDGKPARLKVVEVAAKPAADHPALLTLTMSGRGRHRLELSIRLKLERNGGWRAVDAQLPAPGAAEFKLLVPAAQTEVRLWSVPDRRSYETQKAGETIVTAPDAGGYFRLQWRPRVDLGQIDATLQARSQVLVDVQEDGVRASWDMKLEFSRALREKFVVVVPEGYLVDKVAGDNVRGWTTPDAKRPQRLEITLLRPVSDRERFRIFLSKRSRLGTSATTIEAPLVAIEGAALHSGQLAIRRSTVLDLQTVEVRGATRADFDPTLENRSAAVEAGDRSPLGIVPYQSYAFSAMPFVVRLKVEALQSLATAEVQTLWKVAQRQRSLETRVLVKVRGQPRYKLQVAIPDDFRVEQVTAAGSYDWSLASADGRRVLSVLFAAGQTNTAVVIRGPVGPSGPLTELSLPRVEVLDVDRQQGELVVQADPALNVEAANLTHCERVLLDRTATWLTAQQRRLARIALAWSQADYAGLLRVSLRSATVHGYTVSNTRVTDRTIEETILLDLTVRDAGVREIVFRLPEALRDARISVPLLRQKTVELLPGPAGNRQVRVRLELQDAVMNELRVLVEHDRLHTRDVQEAAIPVLETGRTDARYVAIESAGRDEVVVEKTAGLEPLLRGQQEFQLIASLLSGGNTQAYRVLPGAASPRLTYRSRDQAAVETAGARIGLAETDLVVDARGAYRGVQTYRLYNSTEQFLEVELPEGAKLWTAVIAGEPTKPTRSPGKPATHVRIPLIKTAAGDLDYALTLTYGGTLPAPGMVASVDFPLIHTLNVNVELSNVRLYLPAELRWFRFGGTMREVREEADLQAGTVSYLTKMAERLSQTMLSYDKFSKIRASSSVNELESSINEYRSSNLDYAGNTNFDSAVSDNTHTLREALQNAQAVQSAPQEPSRDNRQNLSQFYQTQTNSGALNVVGQAGQNFYSGETTLTGVGPLTINGGTLQTSPNAAAGQPGQFDTQWLLGNGLVQQGQASAKRQTTAPSSTADVVNEMKRLQQQQSGGQFLPPPQLDAFGRQAGRGQAANKDLGELPAQRAAEDVAQRYQRRLEAQSQNRPAAQTATRRGAVDLGAAAPVDRASGATGLASLDVQIPRRGTVYRFTTPRGEVQVTAQAVSARLAMSVFRLCIVAIVALVAALFCRWTRSGRLLRALDSGLGCGAVILLALLSLLFGLPLVLLALIGLGIFMSIRRWTRAER
jgi:hypothetical protein